MANNVDLDGLPYFEVSAGSRIDVFINGKSRGVYFLSKDSYLYVVLSYPFVCETPEPDDLSW